MFVTKIKAFLLDLYPELGRFRLFNQIQAALLPWKPQLKKFVRYALPAVILSVVLFVGVSIGAWLIGLFRPKEILPVPFTVTAPTPTSSYQSVYLSIKRSLLDFNAALPDPLPPVFDEKISLEPLTE